jgi:hypothetical protein
MKMEKFSIKEFAERTIESSPTKRDYWNFVCECGKHDRVIANVKLSEVSTIAQLLGFSDLLTQEEFYNNLSHAYLMSIVEG